ncbi:centrosomal protein kizuna isoform X3 [Narcine bancroftii]|uniref:centrosomal protein kizuna isoform X3 n=1 Tax=Narcine bancroftii TaxID=1343680 RepID=UPI003831FB10
MISQNFGLGTIPNPEKTPEVNEVLMHPHSTPHPPQTSGSQTAAARLRSAVGRGNGCQAAADMATGEPDLLEREGDLQRQLHASERKRLELEKNLLACNQSDQWKQRSARLKSYLKELHERKRKTQFHNQQLLKDFENFDSQIAALTAGLGTWKQMKIDYEKQVEQLFPVWMEKLTLQGMEKEKMEQGKNSSSQTTTNVGRYLSKGLYHTATHFMGQQTSETANRTCPSPQQNYYQATESFLSLQLNRQVAPMTAMQSNSMMNNLKLLTSSKGRQDFHTVSDIIDGKTGLQGCEVMPLTPIIAPKTVRNNNDKIEINNNIGAKSSVDSPELVLPVAQEEINENTKQNDIKNQPTDEGNILDKPAACAQTHKQFQKLPLDRVRDSASFDMTHKGNNIFQLDSTFFQNKDITEVLRSRQDVQKLADEVYNSESDTNASGTSEELQLKENLEDPCNSIQHPKTDVYNDLERTNEASLTKDSLAKKEKTVASVTEHSVLDCAPSMKGDLCGESHGFTAQSQNDEGCLSFEGFCHLLHCIEDALGSTKTTCSELYQTAAINNETLKEITRICNRKGSLNKEHLDTYGAVVLHQLKELSRSTSNGCLFSDEILNNDWEAVDKINNRLLNLPADSARLWDHWYSHILLLLKYHVLNMDETAELFGPSLVAENSNSKKAIELLKKILSNAVESQFIQSEDASCSLSSILNDSVEMKATNPVHWLHLNKTRQKETRAYELVKQSATQQNQKNSPETHSLDIRKQKYPKKMKNDSDEVNPDSDSSEESSQSRYNKIPV